MHQAGAVGRFINVGARYEFQSVLAVGDTFPTAFFKSSAAIFHTRSAASGRTPDIPTKVSDFGCALKNRPF
jgi:hypothetical protein